MKTNYFLFVFFLFFNQIIQAQEHNQVTSIVTEFYWSDNTGFFSPDTILPRELRFERENLEEFEYDDDNNLIFHTIIIYDKNHEIIDWNGIEYEYDSNGFLIKESRKRYNEDVDLWINIFWIDFVNDENGCAVEEYYQPNNFQGTLIKQTWQVDESCQKLSGQFFTSGQDPVDFKLINDQRYEYHSNGKISNSITTSYIYYTGLNIPIDNFIQETTYNSKGDVIQDYGYAIEHFNMPDTLFNYGVDYENNYQFDKNGQIISKQVTAQRINNSNFSYAPTFSELNYGYSCDGLLLHEEEISRIDSITSSPRILTRKHFTYKDEYPCVDYSENLKPQISPNPSSNEIEINIPIFQNEETTIQIFDLSGKLMIEELLPSTLSKITMDVSNFHNGIYIVFVKNRNGFSSEKLVVAK